MRACPKILILLCLAVALAAPVPAFAQPGGGGGGGGGGSKGPGSSAPAPASTPDAAPPPATSAPPPAHETALEAVQNKHALPLADIIARNGITDQLIDAQLVLVNGHLVYRLKLLSISGQLRVLYFFADTGIALKGA